MSHTIKLFPVLVIPVAATRELLPATNVASLPQGKGRSKKYCEMKWTLIDNTTIKQCSLRSIPKLMQSVPHIRVIFTPDGTERQEIVFVHTTPSMFGEFSVRAQSLVWRFEQRAFYFSSVRVTLILACQEVLK